MEISAQEVSRLCEGLGEHDAACVRAACEGVNTMEERALRVHQWFAEMTAQIGDALASGLTITGDKDAMVRNGERMHMVLADRQRAWLRLEKHVGGDAILDLTARLVR